MARVALHHIPFVGLKLAGFMSTASGMATADIVEGNGVHNVPVQIGLYLELGAEHISIVPESAGVVASILPVSHLREICQELHCRVLDPGEFYRFVVELVRPAAQSTTTEVHRDTATNMAKRITRGGELGIISTVSRG